MSSNVWYRQPWAWFVWIPPLAAVIGGLITLMIAIKSADVVITDDVRKEGMVMAPDLSRENAAAARGLSGELQLQRDQGTIEVQLQGEAPERLLVRFVHPTAPDRDLLALVQRTEEGVYRGALPGAPAGGRWRLQVEPEDRSWRLNGGLEKDASSSALRAGASGL